MTTSTRHRPFAGYDDGGAPLAGYATLISTFSSFGVGALALAARRGRRLDVSAGDLVLLTVATHHLSRLVTKDRVTSVLRAPFTEYEGRGGPGEVEERPRGTGLRRAAGELLTCPYCISQWIAMSAVAGTVLAPRVTRAATTVLVVSAGSDALQLAYRAAADAVGA